MRRFVACVCGLVALVSLARAQATWDFGTGAATGTGVPLSLPANTSGGTMTAGNATIAFNTTSPSSTSPTYTGNSGTNNAAVSAVAGTLSTSTSTYYTFTLTAATNYQLTATGLKLGSRSTASGPILLTLYSSADNFTTALGSVSASANSNWALLTLPGFSVASAVSGSLTFRLYGSGGTSTASNWRIDDVSLTISAAVPPPSITTQPTNQTVTSGTTASFTVAASGQGTLTYQWRKGGTNIGGATSATLNLGTVTTTNAGSYDVVVSDTFGNSTTTSSATLTVNPISTALGFTNTTTTYTGSQQSITTTATPASASSVSVGLSTSYTATSGTTYGPSTTPPTNAGVYAVTTTITDSEHVLSGGNTATFTINQAAETISLSSLTATYDGNSHVATATTSPAASIATGFTYNGSGTAPTNAGSYAVVATITDPNYTGTASGTLTIAQAAQTITSFPAIANHFTSDPPFTVSATASSGLPVTFSITSGSPTIATISGSTITLAGGSSTGSVTVQAAQAGNGNYAAATSQTQTFTVSLPPATITTQPQSQTVTAFQNATFTVAATVGSGTLSYQWRKNGTAIAGNASALTATLTLPSVTATDAASYDVVVTAPGGNVTSFPATLTVNKAATTVTLSNLSATFDGNPHAATATTSPPGLTVGFTYNASATVPTAGGSYAVVATINDANYAGTASGTLVIAPTTQTVTFPAPGGTLRATVPFTVSAIASSGLTVTFSIVSGNATATGTNGATITVADNSTPVVIRATQAGNASYASAFTDLTIFVSVAPAAPAFVTQPTANASYNVGDGVTLTATVSGVPDPTFQWRKGGVALANYPGATTNTLFMPGLALTDAGTYDLVATNTSGSATSQPVVLTIAKKDQAITFPAPTASNPTGVAIKLSATASSGLAVSYSLVSGAASLSGGTLTGFGPTVVVRASQAGNSTTYNAATTVDQTFTFVNGGTAPFIFTPPLDQTVNAGATVTFSAAAIGTPAPAWSWQKDGVAIDGATSATLTLSGVTLADAARYTVTATNSGGTASASAQLNVRAAPAIGTPPASQSVNAGATVTFSAAITGFPAPALQWRKNGVAIPGAVSNNLTLVNVSAPDAARYDLVATNSLGTATSTAATLAVAVHDFSGAYFGKFSGASGDFALYLRANGTGVFLGFLPGLKTALVATNVTVDLAGNFSFTLTPIVATANSSSAPLDSATPAADPSAPIAAATATVTLSGTLNDATGTLSANSPELSATLAGTRATGTGSAAAQAGYYSGAFAGSADGRGYVIVGADGQAFALATSSTGSDGATGTLSATGRLTLTTANQSTLDLGFANGALSGTVRTAAGVTATLTGATDALAGTEHLANLSARGAVAPGAPLIAGFVITGSAAKQVLIRAAGPALAAAPFNLPSTLDDPTLTLFRGNTIAAQNDNWSSSPTNATAITAAATSVNAFAFRNGSADAALLVTLAPGNYTAQVAAAPASANTSGLALVEIYEVLAAGETPGAIRLANLSARSPVVPGAPLIAGFVINGTAPQRVLVRGIGPTLAGFGVAGSLANPTLTLFRGSTAIKTNDDWFRDTDATLIRDAAAKSGAFALGATSLDSSMLLYLDPGAYTAQVSASGSSTGTGIALVEIYEVP